MSLFYAYFTVDVKKTSKFQKTKEDVNVRSVNMLA